LSKHINLYDLTIDQFYKLSINGHKQEYWKQSFEYSERAKARILLELLAESNAKIHQKTDPTFLKDMEKLNNTISSSLAELSKSDPDSSGYQECIDRLERSRSKLEKMKLKIRRENPAYAQIRYPQPVTVENIQTNLLKENTILLEYFLGEEHSYLWMISSDSVEMLQLPKREIIEAKVQVYLEHISKPPSPRPFSKIGHELYSLLIPSKLIKKNEKTHLLIIPDGILNYLPYEALMTKLSLDDHPQSNYLISEYEISYVPSASTALFLKEQIKKENTHMKLLALGDPDFNLKKVNSNNLRSAAKDTLSFSEEIYRDYRLHPLEYSRKEVENIANLYSEKRRKVFLGEAACEENFKQQDLTQFENIHFSTHGILDEVYPARSAIVLTIDDDPVEDGYLQMHEIFNINLNADLVVLSACQTGLGKLIKGEGMVGLSRAFFYAGTASLVVSLWPVNDRSTSELMVNFYKKLHEGFSKRSSLRQAKLELIKHGGIWGHPFHWAPFILIGGFK
jgi:CHAT domain-containing protein